VSGNTHLTLPARPARGPPTQSLQGMKDIIGPPVDEIIVPNGKTGEAVGQSAGSVAARPLSALKWEAPRNQNGSDSWSASRGRGAGGGLDCSPGHWGASGAA
jgi:hypothetical protein